MPLIEALRSHPRRARQRMSPFSASLGPRGLATQCGPVPRLRAQTADIPTAMARRELEDLRAAVRVCFWTEGFCSRACQHYGFRTQTHPCRGNGG